MIVLKYGLQRVTVSKAFPGQLRFATGSVFCDFKRYCWFSWLLTNSVWFRIWVQVVLQVKQLLLLWCSFYMILLRQSRFDFTCSIIYISSIELPSVGYFKIVKIHGGWLFLHVLGFWMSLDQWIISYALIIQYTDSIIILLTINNNPTL